MDNSLEENRNIRKSITTKIILVGTDMRSTDSAENILELANIRWDTSWIDKIAVVISKMRGNEEAEKGATPLVLQCFTSGFR